MALAATVQWDVRTTGNDANGGGFDPTSGTPGTDYSQQNSPQVVFTDLVIGGTTTQLTSAAFPFSAASVGNLINITGGTGFTVGRYQVISVSGVTATMDRAVGTGASTGGTGNLGGSMVTVGAAVTAIADGNTVHIKSGTYTVTTSITFVSINNAKLIGYNTTHNDGGTKPLITTATNSTTLINTGASNSGAMIFSNLSLSNTASTRFRGIWQLGGGGTAQTWVFVNCIFDGFTSAIDNSNGTPYYVNWIHIMNCEIKNCTTTALLVGNSNTQDIKVYGCYFHNNVQDMDSSASSPATLWLEYSIFANSSATFGLNLSITKVIIDHCTFANNINTSATVGLSSTTGFTSITNNIFYGNTSGVALSALTGLPATTAGIAASRSNAFGNNTTNYVGWAATPGDVTLTANPFTASGSGDYSLNSTAGGGTLCKGAGFPGAFPAGLSTGHADIGAVQSSGGGGGGGSTLIINLGMEGGIRG